MNPTTIRGAVVLTKAAYNKYADYRDRKASEAYDALLSAADTAEDVRDSAVENVTSLAGQARKRLDAALADAQNTAESTKKDVAKTSKKLSKKARKQAQKAGLTKKKRSAGAQAARCSLYTVVLAALGAAAYFLWDKFSGSGVSDEPPRVEDFGADTVNTEESRLVYSTQTPEEGIPERDEELLNALEEQLKDSEKNDD
ncbi:hypothetical protein CIP107503_02222 [Corynebacterium diphtheriae]|uniref:hypothetical protein n=1 Tax=Corynebacterium diphtheriae TaxID=1717 RepID=UPI000B4B8037|nr:hypothetical protein [Corynebacterium diphtheriae]OWN36771.1 hypothetical protein AY510_01305 [Corynebacterium diphtheriae bv. gravis]OWN67865.1 hypothetical protein AY518_04915 [Corynebacterium diphtheriae bv. gravis]OWO21818.1 hypothetical protein AY535_03315 [Corynebacterium diphtheriae bv. gravis]OWO50432.1 hypothetical protein AY551_00610 [Corynebacterium diphtheriae bv. gravis]CAB0527835.1 hypothetical protein CIP107503_02222 [Corynebacterium diphtheriae]